MGKYNDVTRGQIEAALNKIGGVAGLNNLLAGRTVMCRTPRFEIWDTVLFDGHEVNLVIVSIWGLGFDENASRIEAHQVALSQGLGFMPHKMVLEVANRPDHTVGPRRVDAAMEAFQVQGGREMVRAFTGSGLNTRYLRIGMEPKEELMFVLRPRK